jgi:hypothetical protein
MRSLQAWEEAEEADRRQRTLQKELQITKQESGRVKLSDPLLTSREHLLERETIQNKCRLPWIFCLVHCVMLDLRHEGSQQLFEEQLVSQEQCCTGGGN